MFKNPLIEAARRGKLNYVKSFIEDEKKGLEETEWECGGLFDYYLTDYRYTALHAACRNGHLEIVEYLLEQGADINRLLKRDSPREITPLILAAGEGHAQVVKCLLDNGADKRGLDESLRLAVMGNHVKVLELLLKHGIDMNKRLKGNSLLSVAMRLNADKIVSYLLENGADFRQQDFETKYAPLLSGIALDLPCNRVKLKAGDCLMATKVLLDFIEKREGRAKMLEYLNDNGNVRGLTALHVACKGSTTGCSKAYQLLEFLLKYGADPTVKDDDGRQPYHSVYIKDAEMREKVVQLFRKYDSQLDDRAS